MRVAGSCGTSFAPRNWLKTRRGPLSAAALLGGFMESKTLHLFQPANGSCALCNLCNSMIFKIK